MATSLGKPITRELSAEVVADIFSISESRAMVLKITAHGIHFKPKGRGSATEQFVDWKTIFKRGNGGLGWDQMRRDLKPSTKGEVAL